MIAVRTLARASALFCGSCVLALALRFCVPPWGAVVTFYRKTNFEHLRWMAVARALDGHYPNRPAPFVPLEHYSDRWTAWLVVPQSARYTFTAVNDDGIRLYLEGRMVIDNWCDQGYGADVRQTNVWLSEGQHALTLLHYNGTGPARVTLTWSGGPIPSSTVVGGRYLLKRLPRPGEGINVQ